MSRGTGSEGGRGLPPQKILVRLRAWGRDFAALEAAIAVFPAFDEKAFAAASLSSDLTVLNQARAIERDFEVIQSYTAELTREGRHAPQPTAQSQISAPYPGVTSA